MGAKAKQLTTDRARFRKTVAAFLKDHPLRDLPWRKTRDPYKIFISEVMLQQTQADRVVEKYNLFVKAFPNARTLAQAPIASVLQVWSGLGYNRRALFLKRAAGEITERFNGTVPKTLAELETLPGIGPYTARAIRSFAFNEPGAFIETNIRTVYLHHFFPNTRQKVSDAELLPLIEQTLDRKNPRHWYNLLMDYGSFLKKSGNDIHTKSAQYVKQSSFKGSRRELRGAMLKALKDSAKTKQELSKVLPKSAHSFEEIIGTLTREGFIKKIGRFYELNH